MTNQKGFVTTEFLIAIAIAFGLTILTFAMTFTLSTVEVVQYLVYSASRAHAAGNLNVAAQKSAAQAKYEQLKSSVALKPLFNGNWFEISDSRNLEIRSGNGDNFEKDYPSADGANKPNMQGVRTSFTAKILEMRWPFIGSVTPEDGGFTTRLNAIIIREVSHEECVNYMKERVNALWGMDGRFSKFRKTSSDFATPWEDNGC